MIARFRLAARPHEAPRCTLCHSAEGPLGSCSACNATFHESCRRELAGGRCSTLGCKAPPVPADRSSADRSSAGGTTEGARQAGATTTGARQPAGTRPRRQPHSIVEDLKVLALMATLFFLLPLATVLIPEAAARRRGRAQAPQPRPVAAPAPVRVEAPAEVPNREVPNREVPNRDAPPGRTAMESPPRSEPIFRSSDPPPLALPPSTETPRSVETPAVPGDHTPR